MNLKCCCLSSVVRRVWRSCCWVWAVIFSLWALKVVGFTFWSCPPSHCSTSLCFRMRSCRGESWSSVLTQILSNHPLAERLPLYWGKKTSYIKLHISLRYITGLSYAPQDCIYLIEYNNLVFNHRKILLSWFKLYKNYYSSNEMKLYSSA